MPWSLMYSHTGCVTMYRIVLSSLHLDLIVDEEISKRGILANRTLRKIQLDISLGLKPGLKATITLQLSSICLGSFQL